MKGPAGIVLGWVAWVTLQALVLLVWKPSAPLEWGVHLGSTAAAALVALLVLRRPRRTVRVLPELSFATVLVALGAVSMLNGAFLGTWLVYTGGGLVALGLGGIARELRAQRRAEREVRA